MNREFTSGLAPWIKAFLLQKHSLGYKYEKNEIYLSRFDAMCAERFPMETTVTAGIGLAWAESSQGEDRGGLTRRLSPVRELARFIIQNGHPAFVIPTECGKNPYRKYVPYIFSEDELHRVFKAADGLAPYDRNPEYAMEAPVILRLLYACGLRPYEARLMLRRDIDLDKGTIFIPESKKMKDRVVVMDKAMLGICQSYDAGIRMLGLPEEYFFPCRGSHPFHNRHWLDGILSRCLINAGLEDFPSNKPRPYDLRHTFATHTLYRWLREGKDLGNCLPYLSAYMGHEKFRHTSYYIHLVPEFFSQIPADFARKYEKMLPEVMK